MIVSLMHISYQVNVFKTENRSGFQEWLCVCARAIAFPDLDSLGPSPGANELHSTFSIWLEENGI